MESQTAFIGGVGILFVSTLIISLFAIKKKNGFFPVWLIGFGVGLLIAFLISSGVGLILGVITTIIAVVVSPNKDIPKSKEETKPKEVSVSDELLKLNSLKEKGAITEEEFNNLKEKLLNKYLPSAECSSC